jgi:hypothetical protein
MRRLVLSCLAALLAVLGLSAASSGASSEAQALQPGRVSVGLAVPGPSGDGSVDSPAVAGDAGVGDALGPLELAARFAGEEQREPVFLGMLALVALAAGLGASARLHTSARRRTG